MEKYYSGILVGGQIRELSELFAWDREIEEIARPIEAREYAVTSKYARTMERNAEEFIEGCDMYSQNPADFYEGPEKPAPVDQVSLAVQSIFACLHVEERVEDGERKRYLHSEGLRKMWETFEFEREEAFKAKKAEWKEWKEDPDVRANWAMAFKRFNSQDSLLGRVEFESRGKQVTFRHGYREEYVRGEGAYAGEARKALDVVDSDGFILQPTDGGDWVERVTEGWHSPVFVVETEGGLAALTAKEVGDGVVRRKGTKTLWLKGALHPASKACRVGGYAPMPFLLGYLTRNTTLAAKVKRCWWDPKALLSTLRGEKAALPSHWSRLVAPAVTSFQVRLLEADPSLLDSLGEKEPLGVKYEGVQGYEEILKAIQDEMINCWASCAQELRDRLWKVRGELETSAEIDAPSNESVLRLARAWGRIEDTGQSIRKQGGENAESDILAWTSFFGSRQARRSGRRLVAISRGVPGDFIGERYTELAPSWDLLKEKDPEKYTKRYRSEVLSKVDPAKVAKDLAGAILLCWEAPGKFCHRRIVAEWLENELGKKVPEFGAR